MPHREPHGEQDLSPPHLTLHKPHLPAIKPSRFKPGRIVLDRFFGTAFWADFRTRPAGRYLRWRLHGLGLGTLVTAVLLASFGMTVLVRGLWFGRLGVVCAGVAVLGLVAVLYALPWLLYRVTKRSRERKARGTRRSTTPEWEIWDAPS